MKISEHLCRTAFLALFVASFAIDPPTWSPTHHVKGTLQLPINNIEIPFEGWYDVFWIRSRFDYYHGLVKTYQFPREMDGNGTVYKIVLATDTLNGIYNFTRCFKAVDLPYLQRALPNMTGFKFSGNVFFRRMVCKLFIVIEQDVEIKSIRKFWIRYQRNQPIPLRYEVRKYSRINYNVHQHYYIDYDYYDTKGVAEDVFVINRDVVQHCQTEGTFTQLDPMSAFITDVKIDPHQHKFHHFIDKYNKMYENRSEAEFRSEIFRKNFEFIEAKNRENLGFKLAINHFADRTDDEYLTLLGERTSTQSAPKLSRYKSENIYRQALPTKLDWRIFGAVSPVRDQKICGSCYAFATAALMESAYFKRTGKQVQFSVQAIMDCSWNLDNGTGNTGCQGGNRVNSLHWINMQGGLPLEGDYRSYRGMEGFCNLDNVILAAPINEIGGIGRSPTALKMALVIDGPISVSIDAHLSTFKFYSSGVYYDRDCSNSSTNHAVIVVGYGIYKGEEYWIVKNSWGLDWGMGGFAFISIRDNNCGVTSSAIYITLRDPV